MAPYATPKSDIDPRVQDHLDAAGVRYLDCSGLADLSSAPDAYLGDRHPSAAIHELVEEAPVCDLAILFES